MNCGFREFESTTSYVKKIAPLLEARLESSRENRWWNGIGKGYVSKRSGSVINETNIVNGSGQVAAWILIREPGEMEE